MNTEENERKRTDKKVLNRNKYLEGNKKKRKEKKEIFLKKWLS